MSRKPVQQRLPFPEPPGLACAPGRNEPTLWIRRILLWQDLSKEAIRDVVLRRGLNIIWSPTGSDPQALAAGHAAGKTLFCRLLRYCLGEDSFADPEDTQAIRKEFPDGAVGAEIRLRGETWVVRRRFGLPKDDRAVKAESFERLSDESLIGSFAAFRNELEEAVFGNDQRRLLGEMADVHDAWQYVLAWLTRDQECRIDGLTHWRHPESSSQSPVRTAGAETRLSVLRVAVGLYSDAANAARREVTKAGSRAEAIRARARQMEGRFGALRDELAGSLGVGAEQIWPPSTDLLQDEKTARENHFRLLMKLADDKIRAVGAVPADPAHAQDEEQLALFEGELARVRERIKSLEGDVERTRQRAKLLEQKRAEHWGNVREAKHPVCPYDGTPLDVDKAKFVCPLPQLPDPAAAERIAAETDKERKQVLSYLAEDERRLEELKGDKASREVRVEALRRRVEVHRLRVAAATRASQAAWATKETVRRLFELREQYDDALEAEAKAKEELRIRQDEQVGSLSAYSTGKLERWFSFLVQRIVAPEATGEVVLDGNGLHPRILWHGTRRSVALNSLQIVLFDLAAMLCAVEGDSRAPAFLVHDSPREGDLDPWTYARLFEALFELGPDESSAPFQYIVTTTTDPPDGRVRSRVRLQIDASEESNRLFQVDF